MNEMDNSTPPSIPPSLLARVQQGDDAAWERLVLVFGPFVYRTLRSRNVPERDIGDVAQDVLVQVHRYVGRFHRDLPSHTFRGWIYTIACNEANEFFRNRGAEQVGVDPPSTLAAAEEESDTCDERVAFIFRVIEAIRGDFEPETFQCFWR